MNSAITTHVSEIVELAAAKHRKAMEAIQRRPVGIAAAKVAQQALADCELLIEDAFDLTGDEHLAHSLAKLRDQRAKLDDALVRMTTMTSTPRPLSHWGTPWPWVSLGIIVLAMLISV